MALTESSSESSSVSVFPRGLAAFPGRDPERTVVCLLGEHDLSSVSALSESLARAIALDETDLIVDLSEVEFMGAATVGVIVRAREFLRLRSRSLSLRSPSTRARLVLEACGLGDLLDPLAADAIHLTGAAAALGTWVAVPATDREDGLDIDHAPSSESNLPTSAP